jgi:outer membrane protein assembly factor BamB
VMCCDREGHVQWLQRSIWLTPQVQDLATKARVEMALIAQSNAPVIVLQPGAAGLKAFDPETGRRVWQWAIPDITRVVGSSGGLIVAMTPRGLLAYRAADGAFVWQRDLPASHFACGLCDDGRVAIASVQPGENGKQRLSLQWISRSDNNDDEKVSIEFPEPRITSVVRLGAIAGRFFIVGYDKEHSAARLLELVPVGNETGVP